MRIINSDAYSSFRAWGIGFCYEYDNITNRLTIIHARRYKPLFDIDTRLLQPEFVTEFVETFEKALQIQALMLSNRSTIDMTEIFGEKRLKSYLGNTAQVAIQGIHLKQEEFASFDRLFCEKYRFRCLRIAKSQYNSSDNIYYKAEILTQTENSIQVGASGLHTCLSTLSGSIISDLLIQETRHNFQNGSFELLSASSRLSTLSLLLDHNFEPRRKIMRTPKSGALQNFA